MAIESFPVALTRITGDFNRQTCALPTCRLQSGTRESQSAATHFARIRLPRHRQRLAVPPGLLFPCFCRAAIASSKSSKVGEYAIAQSVNYRLPAIDLIRLNAMRVVPNYQIRPRINDGSRQLDVFNVGQVDLLHAPVEHYHDARQARLY